MLALKMLTYAEVCSAFSCFASLELPLVMQFYEWVIIIKKSVSFC